MIYIKNYTIQTIRLITMRDTKLSTFVMIAFVFHLLISFTVQLCTVNTTTYPNTIKLGIPNVLCLNFYFVAAGVTTSKTYAFPINADEFSALTIANLTSLIDASDTVNVTATYQNLANQTAQMILFDKSRNIQRQTFSFVLNSLLGQFTNITLDNADCSACTGDTYTCIALTQCFLKNTGKFGANDPKFFISWIGTDLDGNHFLSHTKRLSRFSKYSIGSIYEWARNVVTQ